MSFQIKILGLKEFRKAIKRNPKMSYKELNNAIKQSVHIIRPLMVKNSPYKSGKLRKNIFARASKLQGSVGPDLNVTPYARYVHDGTSAHIIRPKNGKALYWPGARHPVRMVRHPGTKANPFVQKTYEEVKPYVDTIFTKALNNIVKDLAK